MQIVHGTRIVIDQGQPAQGPYVICYTNGCMADYDVNADLMKAYGGPPTDPRRVDEQKKKIQDELQRRANEARDKVERAPGQQPARQID